MLYTHTFTLIELASFIQHDPKSDSKALKWGVFKIISCEKNIDIQKPCKEIIMQQWKVLALNKQNAPKISTRIQKHTKFGLLAFWLPLTCLHNTTPSPLPGASFIKTFSRFVLLNLSHACVWFIKEFNKLLAHVRPFYLIYSGYKKLFLCWLNSDNTC